MNRYHSSRRTASHPTGPIVAFLLIACFGLLFVTGCSNERSAESAQKMEDDTFTAEDLERLRALSRPEGESGGTLEGGIEGAPPIVEGMLRTATGAERASVVDPALRKRYDAIRSSAAAQGNLYRVTNDFLNVRASPGVNAPSVGRFTQGDMLTGVEFINGTWAKVQMPGGQTGYVAGRYISKLVSEERLKEEQKAFEGLSFVNFAFLNVRAAPDSGSEKIGELPSQAFVRPLAIDRDWARVGFENKEGYVSIQFLSPFRPNFLVRQDRYQLPILHYAVDQEGVLAALPQHLARLRQDGVKVLTVRDLATTVLTQEVRDVRLPPRSAVIAITGLTAENVRAVSEALAGVPATLFIQTDTVGIAGISEKMLLTMQANGFDIQSAGHTGDDLRTLTVPQTQLELEQSRTLLEDMTKKTVFAVAYPQGGANDRVLGQAADAGYLFGIGSAPDKNFSREQFLRLPSFTITPGMTGEDVVELTR